MKKILLILFLFAQFLSSFGQLSGVGGSSVATTSTYGRVNAFTSLATVLYVNTGIGSKIPFSNQVYNSGFSYSGTDGLIPSVTGRYKAEWMVMAGSDQMAGDGYIHVVQNGVSVGQLLYNMMEAAGVNQSVGSIDVNLVAGVPVFLYYRSLNGAGDNINWDAGSYFQLTQSFNSAVTPTFGGASAVANGTGGYVPSPTSGQQNLPLRGDGNFRSNILILNSVSPSGVLNGITFTSSWVDPIALTTSSNMTGFITSEITIQSNNVNIDAWLTGTSSGTGARLQRWRQVQSATTINFGLYSGSYSCTFVGYITIGSFEYRVSGYTHGGVLNKMYIEIMQ
jgi:hypothetical protein